MAHKLFRLKIFLYALIVILVMSAGLGVGMLYGLLEDLPHLQGLEEYDPGVVTTVYAANEQVLTEFYQEKRLFLPFKKIPPLFVKALIAVEDNKFYQHWGVNFRSIFRALWVDIKAGRIVQGGSTLTQQLAKVLFLTPEKTFSRKLKELLLALQIEKKYTKNEILEMYVNQIYLGSGSYGLEAASRTYFGKSVEELDLPQIALLAGLPKSPEGYSPFKYPKKTVFRRNHVLKRMWQEEYITRKEYELAKTAPLELHERKSQPQLAPHFNEMVRQYLEEKYGVNMLYRKGLKVYTTLITDFQQAAEKAVAQGLEQLRQRQGKPEGDTLLPEAALLALDPKNGNIMALVGGADFETSEFNRAVQAKRQPGSAFKAIIYTAAMEAGFTPASIIIDEEIVIEDEIRGTEWRPENFDRTFAGPITLRRALQDSRNLVSVKLLERLGVGNVINYARRMGINSHLNPYLSLALGTSEVSLLELTAAYGVLSDQGIRIEPHFIRYITDNEGEMLEETIPATQRVLKPQTAYLVTSMLQGVVEDGTGWRAKALERPVAGKTGTTDDYKDAWFIGYIPQLTAGVWVGFDRKESLGDMETGSRAAAPIWVNFMQEVIKSYPSQQFDVPEGIVFVDIDAETGLLTTPNCEKVIKETFRQGSEPVTYCEAHKPEISPQEITPE